MNLKTKPPCFNAETRTDCPRRYVGCKADCQEWHSYIIAREEERARIQKAKGEYINLVCFEMDRYQRDRLDRARKAECKRRRKL